MSADNYVGFYSKGSDWLVVDGSASASEDDCMYRGYQISVHSTKVAAITAAHEYAKTLPVLEYGVSELSPLGEPCGHCHECVNERKIISEDATRCTKCERVIVTGEMYAMKSTGTFCRNCERKAA